MVAINHDWDELEDNIDEEYDDSANTLAEYTTEPYRHGDLISQWRSGESSFYCFDCLGSTLALTDPSGTVTDTYGYSAFGEYTEHSGGMEIPFQYNGRSGYLRHVTTASYVVTQRVLSAPLGRWCTLKGAAAESVIEGYTYLHNHPLTTQTFGVLVDQEPNALKPGPALTIGEVRKPIKVADCGGMAVEISWKITNPRQHEKGAIIQLLGISYGKYDCNDKELVPLQTQWVACEAWSVSTKSGKVLIEPIPHNRSAAIDRFELKPSNIGTKGGACLAGLAYYEPDYEVAYPPWKKWIIDPDHPRIVGILPDQSPPCEIRPGEKIPPIPAGKKIVMHRLCVGWCCCWGQKAMMHRVEPEATTNDETPPTIVW